jgi:biopolymer transport protein ExbD
MRRPAQRSRVMSEINITPLTDVMMVLLIIFMVTTPLIMKASIDINLPKAHVKKAASPVDKVSITLTKEGKVYVNRTVVKIKKLIPHLRKYFQEGADPSVTVSADVKVPYGDAVRVLDMARQAGAKKLVLAADPLPVRSLSEEMLAK